MEAIHENRCLTHFRKIAIHNDENKLKGKFILFSLPVQTCCLRGKAVKRTYLCVEQGHALIGFLLHGINIPDEENPFAFPIALYCA